MLANSSLTGDLGGTYRALVLNENAADELFRAYSEDLHVYLRSLVGNDEDALDLRQDVFANALTALRSRQIAATNPRGWLFKIARNRAFDHLRRRKLSSLFVRSEDAARATTELDHSLAFTTWSAVERLPTDWREAVVLRYRWGFRTNEIADVQHKSEGAVRAELSRALRRLAKDLRRE